MRPLSVGGITDLVADHPWRALAVFLALCVVQQLTGVFG